MINPLASSGSYVLHIPLNVDAKQAGRIAAGGVPTMEKARHGAA